MKDEQYIKDFLERISIGDNYSQYAGYDALIWLIKFYYDLDNNIRKKYTLSYMVQQYSKVFGYEPTSVIAGVTKVLNIYKEHRIIGIVFTGLKDFIEKCVKLIEQEELANGKKSN